ncbi:hypothetical protein GQ53DRAFT_101404 [Thozetella sp. PMI_491]|nr:hypothetical protein GQ53DRAFT_101404 [Thozetella sp. PMI_491]
MIRRVGPYASSSSPARAHTPSKYLFHFFSLMAATCNDPIGESPVPESEHQASKTDISSYSGCRGAPIAPCRRFVLPGPALHCLERYNQNNPRDITRARVTCPVQCGLRAQTLLVRAALAAIVRRHVGRYSPALAHSFLRRSITALQASLGLGLAGARG